MNSSLTRRSRISLLIHLLEQLGLDSEQKKKKKKPQEASLRAKTSLLL